MSLILLQSEKQIQPGILDSSDRPEDFSNIFRKPIEIENNQTIEVISMSYNKLGDILVNSTNDTVIFRVGDNTNYLNKTVRLVHDSYTPAAFASELQLRLNNSTVLNQYLWAVSVTGSFIYITLNQLPTISTYSTNDAGTTPGEKEGEILIQNENIDLYPGTPPELLLRKQTVFGQVQYHTIVTTPTTPLIGGVDIFDNLVYASRMPKPLFSNGPILQTTLTPQFCINGLDTTAAIALPTTFTHTSNTAVGNLAAYTGSNGYDAQVILQVGGVNYPYYLKYGSNYAGTIEFEVPSEELPWHDRGASIITSTTDVAIPTSIDENIAANFGLNEYEYDTSKKASLTSTVKNFNREITSFKNIFGVSIDATCTDISSVLSYATIGYKNSSVGIITDSDNGSIFSTSGDMAIDYSCGIEQEARTNDTTDTKVMFKCRGRTNLVNPPLYNDVDFFYTLTSGGGEVGPVTGATGIDLKTIAGIETSGANMDNIRISIRTTAGVKSKIIFEIEKETGAGMFSPVLTGRFANESIFTEDFYPLRGVVATSFGKYGQVIGTTSSVIFNGTFSTRAGINPTVTNLQQLGVVDPDFALTTTAPIEGPTLDTKQKLSFFVRFGIVPEASISADNTAGANTGLINIEDCVNQGKSRNNTLNNADLNLLVNQSVFTRNNVGTNDTYYSMTTGPIQTTDYLNENINIQLPDFPIMSFNGLLGQPENCVAIIPAEQIQTDAFTGRLYYQSSVPTKINMNNNGTQKINHIRVRLTTPEGQPVRNLVHPTSIVLKIDNKK